MTQTLMFEEPLQIKGRIRVSVRDAKGRYVAHRCRPNLVVTGGKALIAAILARKADSISHIALGTSATPADAAQTALLGEAFRKSLTSTTSAGQLATFYAYIPASQANGNTYQEAGLFNAATGGTMLARATFGPVAKSTTISITISWTISIA